LDLQDGHGLDGVMEGWLTDLPGASENIMGSGIPGYGKRHGSSHITSGGKSLIRENSREPRTGIHESKDKNMCKLKKQQS